MTNENDTDDGIDVNRRNLLGVTAGIGLAGILGAGTAAGDQTSTAPAEYPNVYSAKDENSLQTPDVEPALGFTPQGAFEWRYGSWTPLMLTPPQTIEDGGTYSLGPGHTLTPGVTLSDDLDLEESAVYLEGQGVRGTTIENDGTDAPVYEVDRPSGDGNFGGISDMTVYGEGQGVGPSEPLLRIHGVIDQMIENVILRYSKGDLLRYEDSASGLRLHNSWIEQTDGHGVWTTSGTRAKLTDLHVLSCASGGVVSGLTNSQFSNISVQNCPVGIDVDGSRNSMTNLFLDDADTGLEMDAGHSTVSNVVGTDNDVNVDLDGSYSAVSNIATRETGDQSVIIRDDDIVASNIVAVQFDGNGNGEYALHVDGDNNHVQNVLAVQVEEDGMYDTPNLAIVTGNNNTIDGLHGSGDWDWRLYIAGEENVFKNITGHTFDTVRDRGTRTLFNGRGTNDGDPRSTGEWEGYAEYAARQDALIEDTDNDELYRAFRSGSWVSVSN